MRKMINRRKFLAPSIGAGLFPVTSAQAALSCTPFNGNGVQQCTAGVQIGTTSTALQECKNWCWAACISTIFSINNKKVSQQRIVEKLFGTDTCSTATGLSIISTINGEWETDNGVSFSASASPLLDLSFGVNNSEAARMVAQELAQGRPVINGALGHATVLTAMTYLVDVYGRGIPQEIIVRDPWPGNQNRRMLTAAEAASTFFIASVMVF